MARQFGTFVHKLILGHRLQQHIHKAVMRLFILQGFVFKGGHFGGLFVGGFIGTEIHFKSVGRGAFGGVGMYGYKQIGLEIISHFAASGQRDKCIVGTRHFYLKTLFFEVVVQMFGNRQIQCFFLRAAAARGPGVFAAVAGVNHNADFAFFFDDRRPAGHDRLGLGFDNRQRANFLVRSRYGRSQIQLFGLIGVRLIRRSGRRRPWQCFFRCGKYQFAAFLRQTPCLAFLTQNHFEQYVLAALGQRERADKIVFQAHAHIAFKHRIRKNGLYRVLISLFGSKGYAGFLEKAQAVIGVMLFFVRKRQREVFLHHQRTVFKRNLPVQRFFHLRQHKELHRHKNLAAGSNNFRRQLNRLGINDGFGQRSA